MVLASHKNQCAFSMDAILESSHWRHSQVVPVLLTVSHENDAMTAGTAKRNRLTGEA